jgi:hypothetical protein
MKDDEEERPSEDVVEAVDGVFQGVENELDFLQETGRSRFFSEFFFDETVEVLVPQQQHLEDGVEEVLVEEETVPCEKNHYENFDDVVVEIAVEDVTGDGNHHPEDHIGGEEFQIVESRRWSGCFGDRLQLLDQLEPTRSLREIHRHYDVTTEGVLDEVAQYSHHEFDVDEVHVEATPCDEPNHSESSQDKNQNCCPNF